MVCLRLWCHRWVKTITRAASGNRVNIGNFDSDGLNVNNYNDDNRNNNIGVSLLRNFIFAKT